MFNAPLNHVNLFQDLLNQSKGFNFGQSFKGPEIAADVLVPMPPLKGLIMKKV